MALVNVEPQAELTVTCNCGHSWKSPVAIESRNVEIGSYSWERGDFKVRVKAKVVDVYCSRCGSGFDRIGGVIDGEDEHDEPPIAAVVPEAYAAPDVPPAAVVGDVEEISVAI